MALQCDSVKIHKNLMTNLQYKIHNKKTEIASCVRG